MESLIQDVRYSIKSMLRRPAFSLMAVATLALGIGASAAVFSVANAVLLKKLPYRDPSRLVLIWERFGALGLDRIPVSASEFMDYREQCKTLQQVAAFKTLDFNMTGSSEPERVPAAAVTADLFPMLGVKPLIGRTFEAGEFEGGRDDVAVITFELFEQRFGLAASAVGKQLSLNGRSYTVIGVMPSGFRFPISMFGIKGFTFTQPARVFVPAIFSANQLQERGSRGLGLIARLRPGKTPGLAGAEVDAIAQQMILQYPESYPAGAGWGAMALPLKGQIVGKFKGAILLLAVAVALLLLIACANVVNLLLARGFSRGGEIAIRLAIGASRARIIRQLLTESLVLSISGGAFGVLLASWGTGLLAGLGARTLPRINDATVDGAVLAFSLTLCLITSLIFGLAPALRMSRLDVAAALKEGGRASSQSQGNRRLSDLAIAAEFAVATMLLIAAGLVVRSFLRLQNVDPGFNPRNLLTFEVTLPAAGYAGQDQIAAFFKQAVDHITHLPGVTSAAATNILPLSGSNTDQAFIVEGRIPRNLGDVGDVEFRTVTPDYFKTMGIPLISGRSFSEADNRSAEPVTVVNQSAVRKFFPGEHPIGKRVTMDDPREPGAIWLTIVGITGDVRHRGLNSGPEPEAYVSDGQYSERTMSVVARTASDPLSLAPAAKREISALDPNLPVYNMRTMDQVASESIAQQQLTTWLLGAFSVLAMLLAALGLYGVVSYSVGERANEIAIRRALGAGSAEVFTLVITRALTVILVGMGVGLLGAAGFGRLMPSALFEVRVVDPVAYLLIPALLVLVALLAASIPARKAIQVDPITALRHE